MRVAIYKRVSTDDQVDGTSLETQERDCRSWVERRMGLVTAVYADEGISGRKEDRPGLQQMLRDASKQLFDTLIVWKYDRLARDMWIQLDVTRKLAKLGISIVSATEGMDSSSTEGRL